MSIGPVKAEVAPGAAPSTRKSLASRILKGGADVDFGLAELLSEPKALEKAVEYIPTVPALRAVEPAIDRSGGPGYDPATLAGLAYLRAFRGRGLEENQCFPSQ